MSKLPEKTILINEKIVFPRLQLIDAEGKNVGVVSRDEALKAASVVSLDLVLIADRGGEGVPVVKIVDHGKLLYEQKKQQHEARKKQQVIDVKEVQLRPKIAEHDFQTKMNKSIDFLKDGKHLKITLVFGRGRELLTKAERGAELFAKIMQAFDVAGLTEQIVQEKDQHAGQYWSRIFYLKRK